MNNDSLCSNYTAFLEGSQGSTASPSIAGLTTTTTTTAVSFTPERLRAASIMFPATTSMGLLSSTCVRKIRGASLCGGSSEAIMTAAVAAAPPTRVRIPVPPRRLSVSNQLKQSLVSEARSAYRERLASAVIMTQQAAAKTIWKFYTERRLRRQRALEHKIRRDLAIDKNIEIFLHRAALKKFRSLVSRYMVMINSPRMSRLWRTVQARYRGWRSRDKVRTLRLLRDAEITAAATFQKRNVASRKIQACWRSYRIRRFVVDSICFLKVRRQHAIRIMQRCVRQCLFYKPQRERLRKNVLVKEHGAAATIQRAWRRCRQRTALRLCEYGCWYRQLQVKEMMMMKV